MKKFVILKTGDTFPAIIDRMGDFEDWILHGLGLDKKSVKIVDVPGGDVLPAVETCKAIVIAGSHAMVTQDLSWSRAIEQWLPKVVHSSVPVLGICYGHQLLARAMGGRVDYHAGGLELGTAQIEIAQEQTSDFLFKDLPNRHSQTVVQLPENAIHIAKNAFEPNHAFRIGPYAWGVQFHPEYDEQIMTAYAETMAPQVKVSGLVLSQILAQIRPTPVAARILQRFGKLVD